MGGMLVCISVSIPSNSEFEAENDSVDSKGVQSSRERRIPFGAAGVEHPQWVAAA